MIRTAKNRFRRYELKYVVPESRAAAVSRFIRPYVVEDPHAVGSPDHAYEIASLYLDSPDLRLFQESREGVLDRVKLRIRRYAPWGSSPVFLEIKRRHNRLVLKDRARVTPSSAMCLLSGGAPDTSMLSGPERKGYDQFSRFLALWFARPVVWVRYRREAWVGAFEPRLRITLDRKLACAASENGDDLAAPPRWKSLRTRGVVLEIKFDGSFPAWLTGLVQSLDLTQQSFSKYTRSVMAGLGPSRLLPGAAWSVPHS